jgi:hypothetical protein
MSIIITGLQKAGTTAAMHLMACDGRTWGITKRDIGHKDVVKLTLDKYFGLGASTIPGKHICMVRDPRDVFVSLCLFAMGKKWLKRGKSRDNIIKLLEVKEKHPQEIDLLTIGALCYDADKLLADFAAQLKLQKQVIKSYVPLFRYHNLVAGNYVVSKYGMSEHPLSEYLGYPVGDIKLPPEHADVKRAAREGDYARWLTPSDKQLLEPAFADWPFQSWHFSNETIPAAEASEYVANLEPWR